MERAFLAENDTDWLDLLGDELLTAGYLVEWASTIDRAMDRLSRRRGEEATYSLAVVDLYLGDEATPVSPTGEQIVRKILADQPTCTLVLVSGLASSREIHERFADLKSHITAFEKYPFAIERFRAVLGQPGIADSESTEIRQSVLNAPDLETLSLSWQAVEAADGADARGRAFEAYVSELLESIALLQCVGRRANTASGEIDLVFEVRCIPGTLTQDWDSLLLVECKSGESVVDASDVAKFAQRLRNARLSLGVLATTSRITRRGGRGAEAEIKNVFLQDGLRIVILDTADFLGSPVVSSGDLYETLQQKVREVRLKA